MELQKIGAPWHTSANKHANNNSKPIPNYYSVLFK